MVQQVTIPLDTSAIAKAVDGNKTYLLLLSGAAVIVANHFGLLPPQYVPAGLDPNNWLVELFALAGGATGRSALKKLEGALPGAWGVKVGALETALTPMLGRLIEIELAKRGLSAPAVDDHQATKG